MFLWHILDGVPLKVTGVWNVFRTPFLYLAQAFESRSISIYNKLTVNKKFLMRNYITWLRSKIGHEPAILVGVSAVIHNEKGEILLIKRGDNGTWACPGGMMEPGEHARETLMREIKEELGVDVIIADVLGVYSNRRVLKYPNGDTAYIVGIFFVCTLQGVLKIDGNEVLDTKFFERLSLPDTLFHMHEQPLTDFFEGVRGVVR